MEKQPLLGLHGISWRYEGSPAPALKQIQLELFPGETVGVVGVSGAGKTTLLLTLAGLIPDNYGGVFTGERRLSGKVGIVFQDPETQFIGLTVEEEIAFSLEQMGLPDAAIAQRIDEVLSLVGLPAFAPRSPFELSGGEKQRVAIASALANQPDILLLDEPTSELDPQGTGEVFALLERLKQESGMAILVASHDTEQLARFCDRLLLLHEGNMVLDLPARAFFLQLEELERHGIFVPDMIRLYHWLAAEGLLTPAPETVPLTVDEMLQLYARLRITAEVGS